MSEQEKSEEDKLRSRVDNFILRNFPQIQMHGGNSAITDVDVEEGFVKIQLGGACSGCGISPMTTQAIKRKLPNEIEDISKVSVATGGDDMGGMGFPDGGMREDTDNDSSDNFPDAPF